MGECLAHGIGAGGARHEGLDRRVLLADRISHRRHMHADVVRALADCVQGGFGFTDEIDTVTDLRVGLLHALHGAFDLRLDLIDDIADFRSRGCRARRRAHI